MRHFDCDLLVVGLGPVGDVVAGLARLQGLSVIAIDKSQAIYPLPRAAVFDGEIMRVFQMLGIEDELGPYTRIGDRYQFLTANREILLDFPLAQTGPYGWADSYAFHQPALESILRKRIGALGVDVRLGVAATGLRQTDDGVEVTLEGADGAQTVRARYVTGCDGASSLIRSTLGVGLSDYDFDEPWLVIDAEIPSKHAPPVVAQQICDAARPITHLAMAGDRFRWEFMILPGEAPDEISRDDRIRELLAPWGAVEHMRIDRKAVYRFHGLVADRWRVGRVFLAGDAAHQTPPFAGQGMCAGIRDAVNLAWKIAAVVRGEAEGQILDSYQEEREPHARVVIETAIAMGRVVCVLDAKAAAARDAEMLARRATGAQDVSIAYPDLSGTLFSNSAAAGSLFPQPVVNGRRFDILLGNSPALIGDDLPGDVPAPIIRLDLGDDRLAPYADALRAWLREQGASSVMVRPDRHVFGVGEAEQLLADWEHALKTPVAA